MFSPADPLAERAGFKPGQQQGVGLAGGGVGGVGDDLAVVVDRGRPFSVPICVVVLSAVAPITVPQRLFVPHTDKMRTRAEGSEDEDEIAGPRRAATPPQAMRRLPASRSSLTTRPTPPARTVSRCLPRCAGRPAGRPVARDRDPRTVDPSIAAAAPGCRVRGWCRAGPGGRPRSGRAGCIWRLAPRVPVRRT